MTFCDQGSDKSHPEIVDVPGGVENNCDFHPAKLFRAVLLR